MAVDAHALAAIYDITTVNISSSAQITTRVTSLISLLSASPDEDSKPKLIALTAKAKAATKLVSIVEIGKRQLASDGVTCFQYNVLSSQTIEIDRTPKRRGGEHSVQREDESDDAFQVIGAPTSATKRRDVPVLTIYLARAAVKELKIEFG